MNLRYSGSDLIMSVTALSTTGPAVTMSEPLTGFIMSNNPYKPNFSSGSRHMGYSNLLLATSNMGRFEFMFTLAMGFRIRAIIMSSA